MLIQAPEIPPGCLLATDYDSFVEDTTNKVLMQRNQAVTELSTTSLWLAFLDFDKVMLAAGGQKASV